MLDQVKYKNLLSNSLTSGDLKILMVDIILSILNGRVNEKIPI